MTDVREYQRRLWQELVQLRIHIYYLLRYQIAQEKYERRVNMFLAVASNGSIATWAIWNWEKWSLDWVWPLIIALSQLVNAVRPYFPYQQRMRAISAMTRELEELALYAEHKWYAVSEGQLTDEQIHEEVIGLRRRKVKAEQTHFGSSPLPHNNAFLEEAENQARTYFRTNYRVEETQHV